ncbi:BRO family, N-terminal domain [Fulvimarina manganoxydans]|uniref:BRO family, N-terminal domain n=1 Tax=Fulvimarina manganoxydans TaxID=937218 RepID=A0A1W2EKJ3_9HYPH|nr:BRO family protein [Fulvimarina manganoxydans]SMD10135.1 BRO family, N-terminal domain [Fulvimarina manganoxydans]
MTGLQTFDFEGDPVRVEFDGDDPLFNGRDCCRCLSIEKPENAFARIPADEKGARSTGTPGGEQMMVWLREPGLYRLIFESRKAEAERFKRWVFHDVLPSIRRTGAYGREDLPLADLAQLSRICDTVRRTHGIAAARKIWADRGGPELPVGAGERPVPQPSSDHQARLIPIVADFLADCCEAEATARVQARPLYQAFCRWAAITGQPTMTENMFGRTMVLIGHERKQSNSNHWLGLRLKTEVMRKLERSGEA